MTEQQLARNLVQAGVVTPQQVRYAAENRGPGVGIAQALVNSGAAERMQILEVEPAAFEIGAQAAVQNAPAPAPVSAPTPASALTLQNAHNGLSTHGPSHENVGLGTGEAAPLDDSAILFDGEMRDGDLNDPVMGTIVTFCNELLRVAVESGASDMHLEPREEGLLPRYRVDGHLRSGGIIPRELQPPIISRFKVLSNLDITENRLPQDGRFRARIGGRTFDFRVSTLPSIYGEKVVMRLLDRSSLVTDLTKLGFSSRDEDRFTEMLNRSYGMILVTGPTGSGKTTTLYAALSAARDETKNVVTVEDPVEYELAGVTQTSVQPDIDLTFAAQLRAILRQDPDVILVGEIRDTETAETSIRAALTGHLVLSTLHTNSAVGAVTRLQDMGVAPFLIASSLSGSLAQRLVRLICRGCRQPVLESSTEYQEAALRLKLPKGITLYKGTGCEVCGGTGYKGRLAVIELLSVDSDLRRAIMQRADADTLRRIAIENGLKTLWEDGIEKMSRGLTTSDEISRVLLGAQDED